MTIKNDSRHYFNLENEETPETLIFEVKNRGNLLWKNEYSIFRLLGISPRNYAINISTLNFYRSDDLKLILFKL